MNNEDEIIKKFYSLKPLEFDILESLKLYREIQEDNCSNYTMELEMCKFPSDDSKRIYLIFRGVADLKLGKLEGILRLLIEVKSIRGHQLENLNFRVVESEYEAFSFYCADFDVFITDKKEECRSVARH